jgi:long-chain acyl-CoA synthetase
VMPGDRICVWTYNCPEFLIAYFGALFCAAAAVPINVMLKREEARFIVADSGSCVIICSSDKLEDAHNIKLRVDRVDTIISFSFPREHYEDVIDLYESIDAAGPVDGELAARSVAPEDPAQVIYTSGTTGKPKGACLSHANLIANIRDILNVISVNEHDRFICLLPVFHSFALTVCILLPLYLGVRTVLFRAIRPFKRVIRSIRRNRITIFVGIPPIYNVLKETRLPWFLRGGVVKFINPLRLCISGASAMPPDVITSFEDKFKIPLLEGYGLTEAAPVVSINHTGRLRRIGSVGLPLPSVTVRTVDSSGNDVSADEVGELLVRGPNVMLGYLNQPKATTETIRDGWLHTGDMARIDEDGFIYIVGRLKEMINVRGFNVYPREVEEVLYQLPYVQEAAVVGVNHPRKGEVPVAFLVLESDSNVSDREILQYLRERLAAYKIPSRIEKRASLPKNATGKVLKYKLKEEAEEELAGKQ